MLLEEPVGELDLVMPDQQVLPVSLEERPSAEGADGIRDERPERVADGGEDDDDPEVPGLAGEWLELRRIGTRNPGVRQDQLRGSRIIADSIAMASMYADVPDGAVQGVQERMTNSSMNASNGTSGWWGGRAPARIADYPRTGE